MKWFDRHLKWINRGLLVLIVALNGYVLVTPLIPEVQFRVAQATQEPIDVDKPDDLAAISRDTNHIVIPRLRLDKPIFVGDNPNLVHKGVWHRPQTSLPGQGSNTVLVGHRFTYKDPAVFYSLDEVKVDDPIVLAWDGKLYVYRVNEVKIVPADALEVEAPTTEELLTVYTCDPLWSVKNRLVLTAKLERTL
jgi:sortase A